MRLRDGAFFLWGVAFFAAVGLSGCGKSATSGGSGGDPGKVPSDTGREDPEAKRVREAKEASVANLKQIGIALRFYHDSHGTFPLPGLPAGMTPPPNVFQTYSWRVAILPYIEQANLYAMIPMHPLAPIPDQVAKTPIKLYMNALTGKDAPTDTPYRVFVGNGAAFEYNVPLPEKVFTDGTANTILVVEAAEPVSWSKVGELEYDPQKPLPKLGIFPGGFHALMADGSVWWVPADTPEKTLRAMITRNGNEVFRMPGQKVSESPPPERDAEPTPPPPGK